MSLTDVIRIYLRLSKGLPETSRWKTIQLPGELLKRVDELVAVSDLGYSSRAELVKEAVRRRVEDLESFLIKKNEVAASPS